jgi:hypothetical protein
MVLLPGLMIYTAKVHLRCLEVAGFACMKQEVPVLPLLLLANKSASSPPSHITLKRLGSPGDLTTALFASLLTFPSPLSSYNFWQLWPPQYTRNGTFKSSSSNSPLIPP